MTSFLTVGDVRLFHGDALDVLKGMPSDSVDSAVLDPPYALGFMGRAWDRVFPPLAIWREVYRVLKPGAHIMAFSHARTAHRLAVLLEDAGFEIAESFLWMYGADFPKVGELARHGKTEAEREALSGIHGAVKVLHEPIVHGRKPFSGPLYQNVLEHGVGGYFVEGCRVGVSKAVPASPRRAKQGAALGDLSQDPGTGAGWNPNTGRHPPTVLLQHSPGCERVGVRRVKGQQAIPRNDVGGDRRGLTFSLGARPANVPLGHADPDGLETVDDWRCTPSCPARALGEMSGERAVSGAARNGRPSKTCRTDTSVISFGTVANGTGVLHNDTGTAARFFPQFAVAEGEERFLYHPKARGEKSANLPPGVRCWHPTVKPAAVMQWLVRLVTPPGGLVLDCFAGTGSTGRAALLEGMQCVLIEREASYLPLIKARLGLPVTMDEVPEEHRPEVVVKEPAQVGLFGGPK